MEPVAMRVVILQQDIAWADPAENVRQAEAAIDRRPGADLYVLPEMFATGFATHPEGVAEPADSETLRWMVRKAAACRAAVAGSLAVEDGGRYYNRLCFVHPDGRVETYDKRHLFTYSGASVVIDPYGRTIATCEDHHVSAAEAELDLERLAAFRQKFPVLEDGDAFSL